MSIWCYSEMSNWSNSNWCYCDLILGELKIEKSVIRFGGIKSGIKTPEIPLVNELGPYFKKDKIIFMENMLDKDY